ncbi:MAG: YdcF family protein [Alphaproteobacteria bacterium]|nr:YdcF family protein [Alphaproteobacteria bacterium]
MKRLLPLLGLLLMSLSLWVGAAVLLDWHGRRSAPDGAYDAVIVAGCRVGPDGLPSKALARRTRHGVRLWQEGRAPVLVFTGGVGTFPPAEAVAAAELARSLGVPDAAIVIEDRSTSTEENARHAAEQLAERGVAGDRVLVVSDAYHVFRATRVFARHFPSVDGVGSTPGPWVRVRGSLREVLAVGGYLAMGRIDLLPR